MTATLTYNSLVQLVQTYCDRTDDPFVSTIPTFIANAEARLARELKVLGFLKAVTSTFTPGTAILAKPALWRETVSFNVGSGTGGNTRNTIVPRTYEYLRTYWPDPSQTGQPKYYCDYDYTHWLVSPTPGIDPVTGLAYPFEVLYYELVEPLDANNQTNFLTDYAPDMLLFAVLLETAPFLKDDERIQTWQARYDRCLQAEVQANVRRVVDRSNIAVEK